MVKSEEQPASEDAPTKKETKTKDLAQIVASARTGLIPPESALMDVLPKTYDRKPIASAIDYLINRKELNADERAVASSIKSEMAQSNYVIVVNGRNAKPSEIVVGYLVKKEHKVENKPAKPYLALEIEIASVQEGGHKYKLRL